ncbi:hypothetical protein ABES13_27695 [Bacillus pseudomycoides]|jgi:hypothetical protein|uniref:hypothetical protein n=1 Tax=Bacillus pseudomycoides TaxID=64104 RepID=UPI000BED5F6F|nr:hypothetical protein [Bacillus pseudomycoides]PEE04997.1 hypothetical protein CON86_17170 [Bacillus pseudomycoides]PEM78523.1 hypothetical protein CN632_07130 [Bacillus pseudomycoides]PHC85244.1 hypothetical protein COF63_14190 [Bacillus pseudomycoides]
MDMWTVEQVGPVEKSPVEAVEEEEEVLEEVEELETESDEEEKGEGESPVDFSGNTSVSLF